MSLRPSQHASVHAPRDVESLFSGLHILLCDTEAKRKAVEVNGGVDVDLSDGVGLPPGWDVRRTLLGEFEYFSDYATTRSFKSKINNSGLKYAWSKYLKRFPPVEETGNESGGGDSGDFGDLPPGWKLAVDPTGYFEYVSEYATTRSFKTAPSKSGIAQAWKRYRSHTRAVDLTPMVVDLVPTVYKEACSEGSGSFGSLSKTMHRMRVVEHLRLERCRKSIAPSVAYIGAPDKTDSEFFQGLVDGGTLPQETSFHAINYGTFAENATRSEFPNVMFHENTTMQDFMETGSDDAYTVVWLDFTGTAVEYYTLRKACQLARTHVMLVLSLRKQNVVNVTRTVDAMATSIGVSLTHVESYRGLSSVRNMAFYEIDCSTFKSKNYTSEHEDVGKLAYISEEAGNDKMFKLTCAGVDMYMCFCIGYTPSTEKYTMVPYDTSRHLMDPKQRISVDYGDVLYRAHLTTQFESGACT
jgi:hypothetical protein